MDKSYQAILGHLTFTENTIQHIHQTIQFGELTCASDGSYSPTHQMSTHAYIILNQSTGISITGAAQTPGHSNLLSSYRSELHGQAAIYLLILSILQYHGQCPIYHLESYTDNQETANQIQKLYTDSPFQSYATSNPPEADILAEIRHILTGLTFNQNNPGCEWVKGHQDRTQNVESLSTIAKLNIQMDQLASDHLHILLQTDSQPVYFPYIHNPVTIYHRHLPIHTKFEITMRSNAGVEKIKQYIQQKMQVDNTIFSSIDWESHLQAFKSFQHHEQINIAKFLHNWLNTGTQQSKITPSTLPTCPCCPLDETPIHFLQCTGETILESKYSVIESFIHRLKQHQTSPQILHYISNVYVPWLYNIDPVPSHDLPTNDPVLHTCISEQQAIGIQHLAKGRISKSWRTLQLQFGNNHTWQKKFITELWISSLALWRLRNQQLHQGQHHLHATRLQWLNEYITSLYESPLSNEHPEFFNTPVAAALQQIPIQKIKWIHTLHAMDIIQTADFSIHTFNHRHHPSHSHRLTSTFIETIGHENDFSESDEEMQE